MDPNPATTPSAATGGYLRRNALWKLLHWPFRVFCHSWIRLQVRGLERISSRSGGLLLVNHQSFLDPLLVAVMMTRPVSFLARDSLFKVPVIGWILRNTHVIPISRESARGGSIRTALERLQQGFLVGMFPEGTRSSGMDVRAFRPGFLAVARRTELPIHPVGIAGADRVLPRGAWFLRPGRIRVVIGPPLDADDVAALHDPQRDDAALCELVQRRVSACVSEASELL
jgi:1-acyl-sn-glycerol-3-phosphate acyltransferase